MAGARNNRSSSAFSMKTPVAAKKIVKKATPATRKSGRSIWQNTEKLLSDPKSPLYKEETDIEKILTIALSRNLLNPSIAAKIRKLREEDALIDAIEDFKTDGREGMNDPEWRVQAYEAYLERGDGKFDGFLRAKIEEEWSCTLPPDEEAR